MVPRTIDPTVAAFAARLTSFGFSVYIAEAGTYGFITDDSKSRVLSFSFNDGGSLSGNYGPPSHESGAGWRMNGSPYSLRTKDDVTEALYALAPAFAGKGWRYLSTVDQYLAQYGASSRFEKFEF